MNVHISHLLAIHILLSIQSRTEKSRGSCPHLCFETLVADSHTDCRCEPFAEVDIDARTDNKIAGTIAFMDEAVAFNVVTGSIVLGLGMLGLLLKQDEES